MKPVVASGVVLPMLAIIACSSQTAPTPPAQSKPVESAARAPVKNPLCPEPTPRADSACAVSNTTPLPVPIAAFASAVVDGYIYAVAGASNANGSETSKEVYFAKLDDHGTPTAWAATTPIDVPIMQTTLVGARGHLYLIGGVISSVRNNVPIPAVIIATLNKDGTVQSWSNGPALPLPNGGGAAVALNGYLYFLGGYSRTGKDTTSTGDVYVAQILDNGSLTPWKATKALPGGRFFTSATASGHSIYVVGGFYEVAATQGTFKSGVSSCEPNRVLVGKQNTDGTIAEWKAGPTFAAEVVTGAVGVVDGALLIAGGFSHRHPEGLLDVLASKIDADGSLGPWSVAAWLPDTATSRGFAASDKALYVLGGSSVGQNKVTLTTASAMIPFHGGKVDCSVP